MLQRHGNVSRCFARVQYVRTRTTREIVTHSRISRVFIRRHTLNLATSYRLVHVRTYQTTKHSPDRNQYTVPLHAVPPSPSPILPLFRARSSFAISSAAVYANGAVDTSYDYAVPELGTVPLLNQDGTGRGPAASSGASDQDSIFSKTSSRGNKTENKKVRGLYFGRFTCEIYVRGNFVITQ